MSSVQGYIRENFSLNYSNIENLDHDPVMDITVQKPNDIPINSQPMIDLVDPSLTNNSTQNVELNEQKCPSDFPYRSQLSLDRANNYNICYSNALCALEDDSKIPLKLCGELDKTDLFPKPDDLEWPPNNQNMRVAIDSIKLAMEEEDQKKSFQNAAKQELNMAQNTLNETKSNYSRMVDDKEQLEKDLEDTSNKLDQLEDEIEEKEEVLEDATKEAEEAETTTQVLSNDVATNNGPNLLLILSVIFVLLFISGGLFWYFKLNKKV